MLTSTLRDLEPITDIRVANRYPEIATMAMLGDAPPDERKAAARVWVQALTDSVPDDDAKSLYHHYGSTASHGGCETIWRT